MTGAAGGRPTIETVLLDAGGVLLDLDYAYLGRLLAARGHRVASDDLARAEALARTEVDRRVRAGESPGGAWRDYFRLLLREVAVPVEAREEVIDALAEAHERVGIWTVAIPGALDAVQALRAGGFRLGVVSNAEGRVERDLESAGFVGVFETVVDSHHVGVAKPDPAIFRIALERMRARAETAVFLGDVPAIDVEGARSAGIAPLLLDRFGLYPDVDVPRLQALAELVDWLTRETRS